MNSNTKHLIMTWRSNWEYAIDSKAWELLARVDAEKDGRIAMNILRDGVIRLKAKDFLIGLISL